MNSPQSEPIWRPEIVPGERIFLSHTQREDLPLFARWLSDLETTAYLGQLGMAFRLEHEQEWFDAMVKDRTNKNFAIVVRPGQRLIGGCGLMNIDDRHGRAELGILIGDKSAWGKGYGSEAVRLLADYGLTFLGLHTIYLWHASFNERGHHAYLKAGFKLAGRLRGAILLDGQRYDHVLMDITRDDLGPSGLRGLIGQLSDRRIEE